MADASELQGQLLLINIVVGFKLKLMFLNIFYVMLQKRGNTEKFWLSNVTKIRQNNA